MDLTAPHRRLPVAFEAARGSDAAALFPDQPELARLVAGAAGSSPFLAGLIAKEAEWLAEVATDVRLSRLLRAEGDLKSLPTELRRVKRQVALVAALADLGGRWSLEEVTAALTALADWAVDQAITALVGAEVARGKLPGVTPGSLRGAGGMVALAMGKMGAGELNYSSDIDLICLFDESRFADGDFHEARSAFIRVTRNLSAMLSDVTAEGYVFRTDLRLRPDPAVTPVCLSMEAAERYYESLGRTWERAAYIKARAAAGDIAAGDRFLDGLSPFVWRRHLDFAAIRDAHDMRLRIREHKGLGGPITLPGHNMKLGRGGIREIEFFAQTRQLISGGRDPALRVRGTVEALRRLAEAGWIETETARVLSAHYRAHREIEHRLQMIADTQTHALPATEEGFERLACLMGRERGPLMAEIRDRLEEVHGIIERFFQPSKPAEVPDFGAEVVARWRTYAAFRSARAEESFARLKPVILGRLSQAARPMEALAQFDGFLAGLPAGVQLFALFEANPQLVDLVVDICATAPGLARYLSANAVVFDAVIGGDFFADWPGKEILQGALADALARRSDYEGKLDEARRWMKEWHFRVGVHHLRGLIGAAEAGAQYADLAEAVIAALWPVVTAAFGDRHGQQPGRGAAVVAMGSLGAGRIHAASDLDLIVIYDAGAAETSQGRRPLAVRPYFSRLTQALVTALKAPMPEGRLYDVDMRLRPSGRQGPVATSLQSFARYQREEAWTWEHLALTRARVVAGGAGVSAEIEAVREEVLAAQAGRARIWPDLVEMRSRIATAKPPEGPWDAKLGPGRLQDIELFAQGLALTAGRSERSLAAQLAVGVDSGQIDRGAREVLAEAARHFWAMQVVARLIGLKARDELTAAGAAVMRRELGVAEGDIAARSRALDEAACAMIDAALHQAGEA